MTTIPLVGRSYPLRVADIIEESLTHALISVEHQKARTHAALTKGVESLIWDAHCDAAVAHEKRANLIWTELKLTEVRP